MIHWYWTLLLMVLSFIAGCLVYRNNADKARDALKKSIDELVDLKKRAGLK